jgi:hypothetical protein
LISTYNARPSALVSNALTGRVIAGNLVLAVWLLADAVPVRAFIVVQDVRFDIVEIIARRRATPVRGRAFGGQVRGF